MGEEGMQAEVQWAAAGASSKLSSMDMLYLVPSPLEGSWEDVGSSAQLGYVFPSGKQEGSVVMELAGLVEAGKAYEVHYVLGESATCLQDHYVQEQLTCRVVLPGGVNEEQVRPILLLTCHTVLRTDLAFRATRILESRTPSHQRARKPQNLQRKSSRRPKRSRRSACVRSNNADANRIRQRSLLIR